MPLTLLAETRGWVAIDKPPGTLVVPGRATPGRPGPATPTLREQLEAQLGQPLWVVHRLDRDTSGVLVFARDAETHRALSMAFEAGHVHKRYQLLVQGRWEAPLTVDVALSAGRKGKMRPAAPGEPGKPSRTHFTPLEHFAGSFGSATWVEARPETGRTHQIRVHARCAGHALLVDPHYGQKGPLALGREAGPEMGGDVGTVLARTPLHSASLELPDVPGRAGFAGTKGQRIEAPLPEDLARVLAVLRLGAAVLNSPRVPPRSP